MEHLLCIHGALGHPDDFSPLLPYLSPTFNVHLPLLGGHGSKPFPADASILAYVDQIDAFCKSEGIERAHFFGYSMGGYIALAYAKRFPGKVASIATLGTKMEWSVAIAEREARMLDADKIKEKVPRFAAELEAMHGPQWTMLTRHIALLMQELGKAPELSPEDLALLERPVRLLVGNSDKMVTLEETRATAGALPNGNWGVLPSTGHPFKQVRPALLSALLADFWSMGMP